MIDVLLLVILAAVTYSVASDGPWGAAITFVSVLLAGLLAMNFFEPLAIFFVKNFMNSYLWQFRWDIIALLGLFAIFVTGFRMLGEKLLPTYAEVNNLLFEFARWGFGLATGYVVMAIILTALHVAPLPRDFMGFTPERKNFFQISAPDRQWLAFTQYVSEKSLSRVNRFGIVPIFDGPSFPRNPSDPNSMQVWSSFPIRYADRREQLASGSGGGAGAPSSAPPAAAPPSSGGGGNAGPAGF